jgi:hypothetical protein
MSGGIDGGTMCQLTARHPASVSSSARRQPGHRTGIFPAALQPRGPWPRPARHLIARNEGDDYVRVQGDPHGQSQIGSVLGFEAAAGHA